MILKIISKEIIKVLLEGTGEANAKIFWRNKLLQELLKELDISEIVSKLIAEEISKQIEEVIINELTMEFS